MNKKENLPAKVKSQELAKITKTQFVKDYSIMAIQKKCRKINELPDAIKSDMPSIAKINKQFGEDFIQAYIEGWIVNLREFFNIGKNMTDEQTQDTAILIVDLFYTLTLADINLIFKKAKLFPYGNEGINCQ